MQRLMTVVHQDDAGTKRTCWLDPNYVIMGIQHLLAQGPEILNTGNIFVMFQNGSNIVVSKETWDQIYGVINGQNSISEIPGVPRIITTAAESERRARSQVVPDKGQNAGWGQGAESVPERRRYSSYTGPKTIEGEVNGQKPELITEHENNATEEGQVQQSPVTKHS